MDRATIKKMQSGGAAPFDIQIAFNIIALLIGVQLYDNYLKDTVGGGKTIDELVGLK
tara:strand:+ start:277 stop:447 length:171 start_codon:yes stop_codon:yes gene_type:complete